MKKYLITYDVHRDHERIIQDLIKNGWHSVIQGYIDSKPTICYLSETTWWKECKDQSQAYYEFQTIAGITNIVRQAVTVFDEILVSRMNPLKHQIEEAKKYKLLESFS